MSPCSCGSGVRPGLTLCTSLTCLLSALVLRQCCPQLGQIFAPGVQRASATSSCPSHGCWSLRGLPLQKRLHWGCPQSRVLPCPCCWESSGARHSRCSSLLEAPTSPARSLLEDSVPLQSHFCCVFLLAAVAGGQGVHLSPLPIGAAGGLVFLVDTVHWLGHCRWIFHPWSLSSCLGISVRSSTSYAAG